MANINIVSVPNLSTFRAIERITVRHNHSSPTRDAYSVSGYNVCRFDRERGWIPVARMDSIHYSDALREGINTNQNACDLVHKLNATPLPSDQVLAILYAAPVGGVIFENMRAA